MRPAIPATQVPVPGPGLIDVPPPAPAPTPEPQPEMPGVPGEVIVPAAGPMPSGGASTVIASQPMFVDQNGTMVAVAAAPQPTVRANAAPQLIGTFQQTQVAGVQNQVNSQGKVVGQIYTVAAANGAASNGATQVLIVPGSTPVPMAGGTQILMVPPENAAAAAAAGAAQQPAMVTVPSVAAAGAMPPLAGSTIIAAQPGLQAATVQMPEGISSMAQAVGTQPGQPAIASATANSINGVQSGTAGATADGRTIAASTPAIYG